MLQTNLGRYKYIISDRSKYAINFPTFKYEVKLRTEGNIISKSLDKLKIKLCFHSRKSRNGGIR